MQHGFRQGLSTTTQLAEIIHDFADSIDSGLQADVIFVDFSKVSDRSPHNLLIYKLKSLGNNSKFVTWIEAYLCHRSQFVYVNNAKSDHLAVFFKGPARISFGANAIFSVHKRHLLMYGTRGKNKTLCR